MLNVGTEQYSYDANGNMTSGSGRAYSWNADNQPTSITSGGASEQYSYDADNERLSRTHDGLTTYYLAGVLEADVQSGVVVATRTLYPLQGQVVATRTPGGLFYLHGDHLGSVALSVNAATGATSSQEFDPWGAMRSGSVPQTSLNYTGQRKDGTGLLYYHARYYDPALARWTSPDSLVPGAAMGAGGALGTLGQDQQTSLRPLTVDFHEPSMAVGLGGEDRFTQAQGFWFQLSRDAKQKAPAPWGPGNPQALNRYSYVLENPLRYTDPTGHFIQYLTHEEAEAAVFLLIDAAGRLAGRAEASDVRSEALSLAVEALEDTPLGEFVLMLSTRIGFDIHNVVMSQIADSFRALADSIETMNGPCAGVAIMYSENGGWSNSSDRWYVMNRDTGQVDSTAPGSYWLHEWIRRAGLTIDASDEYWSHDGAAGGAYWLDIRGASHTLDDFWYHY